MKQIRAFRNRALHRNRKGGIEGLPLQLMIVIIIASMGLAMMVGWMGNIEEPQGVGEIQANVEGSRVVVTVYDYDGVPIEGADVVLSGMGVHAAEKTSGIHIPVYNKVNNDGHSVPHGTTDENGSVSIGFELRTHQSYGYLDIEVSKPGFTGSSTRVMVTA